MMGTEDTKERNNGGIYPGAYGDVQAHFILRVGKKSRKTTF